MRRGSLAQRIKRARTATKTAAKPRSRPTMMKVPKGQWTHRRRFSKTFPPSPPR